MIKFYLALAAFLLIQLFAIAQNKKMDSVCPSCDREFREIGGQLNMQYDGERLRIHLLAYLPDTSSMAKKLIKEKNDGHWSSNTIGKMKIGEQEVRISLSSSDISYEVHNHLVQFKFYFKDIPCVVNEAQSFDVLMEDFSPDSATFVCTGNEAIQEVQPAPESLTNRLVRWTATDTSLENRHSEYLVVLAGSSKGAFGFSRLSLRQQNGILDLFWDDVIRYLLIIASFWYLWYLLVAARTYFEKADPKMVNCVIKWIPWLAGFYFVIILDRFVSAWDAMAFMSNTKGEHWQPVKDATTRWRIGLTATAVLLLVFQQLWRKSSVAAGVLLIKTSCRTLAFSMLVFLLLGAVNQVADHALGNATHFRGLGGYLKLEVSAQYAVWAISLFFLYIAFVFFKLFAFKHILQVITITLTLLFAPLEPYRILGEAETQKFESGISFSYPIKKIGEAKGGILNLSMSFWKQADQFSCIPLLLVIYLISMLARRNDQQKVSVVMASFFTIFYCCYLVNMRETFLLLPVTLLSAIWLSRLIIVRDKRARLALIQTSKQLYTLELSDSNVFRNMPELRQSAKLKETYRQRLLNGELLPADYEKATSDLDKMVGEPHGEIIRRRMEFGPFQQSLRNGLFGLVYGALMAALVYLIYFKLYLVDEQYEIRGLPDALSGEITSLILQHLSPVMLHCMAGFCLGYFFPFLKGNTGWEKGAWLGATIGLAHLPITYLTVESPGWAPLAGIFFKHVIILVLAGFLAFDLVTIRKIYGRRHSWKQVVDVMGWKNTLALGTFVLAAVGAGITAWISGNVQDVLKSLLGGN